MSGEEFFHLFDELINKLEALKEKLELMMKLKYEAKDSDGYIKTEWSNTLVNFELYSIRKLVALPAFLRVQAASSKELEEYKSLIIETMKVEINLIKEQLKKSNRGIDKEHEKQSKLVIDFTNEKETKRAKEIQEEYNKSVSDVEKLVNERTKAILLFSEKQHQLEEYTNKSINVIKEEMLEKIVAQTSREFLSYVETKALSKDEEALARLAIEPTKIQKIEELATEFFNFDNRVTASFPKGISYNPLTETVEIQQAKNVTALDLETEKQDLAALKGYCSEVFTKDIESIFRSDKVIPLYQGDYDFEKYDEHFFKKYMDVADISDLIKECNLYLSLINSAEDKEFKTQVIKDSLQKLKDNFRESQEEMIKTIKSFYNKQLAILEKLGIITISFEDLIHLGLTTDAIEELSNIPTKFADLTKKIEQRFNDIDQTLAKIKQSSKESQQIIIDNINELIIPGNDIFNRDTFVSLMSVPFKSLDEFIATEWSKSEVKYEVSRVKGIISDDVARKEQRISSKEITPDENVIQDMIQTGVPREEAESTINTLKYIMDSFTEKAEAKEATSSKEELESLRQDIIDNKQSKSPVIVVPDFVEPSVLSPKKNSK